MRILPVILFVILAFYLSRCAQQIPPSGGYRDIDPPILDTTKTNAIPGNLSTYFAAKEIVLRFNEFVTLDNPANNIIITPPLSEPPQYRLKGKKLFISLPDELLENTTYTINFGNSIKDLTEGNKMKNFSYIFSTGSFIDSLSVSGTVYDAVNKIPVENATVILYNDLSDSAIIASQPLYFTKTNSTGKFDLKYLKGGEYKIIALADENGDLKFNENENIGYLDNTIQVSTTDSLSLSLVMFPPVRKKQFVSSKTYSNGKIELVMNKPSDSLLVFSAGNVEILKSNLFYSKENDTVSIWVDSITRTHKSISLGVYDWSNDFYDTIKVPFGSGKSKIPDILITTFNAGNTLNFGNNLIISTSRPLSQLNESKIVLVSEKDTIPFTVDQINSKQIVVNTKWKEGAAYSLTLYPNAFTDIYGVESDTIKKAFRISELRDYGNLLFNLSAPDQQYRLQLLSGNSILSDTLLLKGSFKTNYQLLPPGNYTVKLIFDDNKNGKWDTGNYWNKQQPERIEYYGEPVNIRPGWDLDITWEIKK